MKLGSGFLVAAALSALPLSAFAQEQPEALEAGREDTGRVSVVDGGALFGRGPYDEETWELSINAILRQGDEVFTEGGTYAEMELPGGTFLRLDANTTVVIQRIDEQGVEVALAQGAVYLSRGPQARPAVVQTFGGAVELGGNSMARIGADAGRTSIEIKSARGSAEMRTDSTAIAVPERKTLVWTREGTRSAAYDAARLDDFDRWNEAREDVVRGTSRPEHVAAGAIGSYELEGNGTWVMIDGYWAWRPTVVYAGWRPYSYGYWHWTEPWGWTWVDYYSWGYTTCHYGRWYYRNAYGWVWYPDPYWAGAWVVWAAFGPHIGWAPCDFWGRPIYVYSYNSYYDYGAWCYTDSNYFYSGGGYVTRSVRTSTSRSATGRRGTVAASIGRSGTHTIRTFDAQTIREYTPVPVRDSVRELTPRNIAQAAERGTLKGVRAEDRRGDLLARAAKDGGVRPEPWADRGGRDREALAPSGRGNAFGGDRAPARDPGRASEGWGVPGRGDADRSGGRAPSLQPRGSDGWGGSNDRATTPSWGGGRDDSNDRGSSAPSFGGGRDNSSDRGSSAPSWGGNRGNSSSSQPDRGWTPPSRDSGSSRGNSTPSYTPPRSDPPKRREAPRNDPPKRDDKKPKPRASWGDRDDRAYSYGARDSGRSNTSAGGSRSSWGSSKSSWSEPSRSNSSTSSWSSPSRSRSSKSSWSAPSRSSSSKSSWSAPSRSSSSSKSYSAPKSRSSSKSYSAPSRSRSSSKSSGSRSSSSSSKSSSSNKRGRR